MHVFQIVNKKCVIIIVFTQPSESRNLISIEFILYVIAWLGKLL